MGEAAHKKAKEFLAKLKAKKKWVEGKPPIPGVSKPKIKRKAKHIKKIKVKKPQPANVGVGPRGGRYIQEPSGHKKYVREGELSGRKKIEKADAVKQALEDILLKSRISTFIKDFKRSKNNE